MEHETVVGLVEPHIGLTYASKDSNMWSILCHLISSVREEFSASKVFYASHLIRHQLALIGDPSRGTDSSYVAYKHAFLDLAVSLSPPFVPLTRPYSSDEGLEWLTNNEKLRAWRNSLQSDILIVDGAAATTGRASECILRTIRQTFSHVSYGAHFTFDKTDNRRNNSYSFLASVVAHWITHPGNNDATWMSEYPRFAHQHALTERDLLSLLIKLRTFEVYGETIFVLDNVEQCHDLSPFFWDHMAHMFETREHPVKFVLTTRSRENLSDDWLMKWPCIHMDTEMDASLDTDPIIEAMLETEILQLFEMEDGDSCSSEDLRTKIVSRSAQHAGLAHFMLQQCRRAGALSGMTSLPQLLDTPIEELLEITLGEIAEGKRLVVATTISWVSYAFRPLSTQEFISAITTNLLNKPEQLGEMKGPSGFVDTSILADLNNLLPGILDLKYDVRFQHPQLRDFFSKADNKWYDINRTAHKQIAETCLQYLTLPQCHVSLSHLCTVRHGTLSTPICKPRDDLAAYAAENWVQHYTLAPQSTELTALAEKFFRNKAAVRAWEQACWFMTNPLTRTDRCYVSILPLIASVGLQDLLDSYGNDETSRQALVEAARNGHNEIVQQLLDVIEIDNATAEATLLAACSHGDEQLLISLVNRFSSLPALTLPPLLISQASWLGHQQLAKLLIDRGIALAATNETFFSQTPLHHAARHGHTAIAELVLARDPTLVSALAKDEISPLKFAAVYGHPALARLLLDHGADKDACTAYQTTPLATACLGGQHATARVLLDAGADPNLIDPADRWPALVVAASNGYERCVRLLLDHGADFEMGSTGGTALYRAVYNNHAAVCHLLLERGASVNCSWDQGLALSVAAGNNNLQIVKLLVEHGADVNGETNEKDPTTLLRAILTKGAIEIVRYLLDNGADVNAVRSGTSPLWTAIFTGDADTVRLLVTRGADVTSTTSGGWTPLHAAFRSAPITRILLSAGAPPNTLNDTNTESALLLASWHNRPAVVSVLLAHNADPNLHCRSPNADDDANWTALYCAAANGHARIVRALLEAGADPSFHDRHVSVLHAAAAHGGPAALRTLLEFRPDLGITTPPGGNTALHIHPLPLRCAKLLVHAGLEVDCVNDAGWTPLCVAVAQNDDKGLDVARFLLGKGARVDVATKGLGSPLHLACAEGSLDGVKMLVGAGADVGASYPQAGTAVYAACTRPAPWRRWGEGEEAAWREEADRCGRAVLGYLLRECGADVNQGGGDFGSALGAACAFCSVETVEVLLEAGARVDVCDACGRYAVHLAAAGAGVEVFERMCEAGSDWGWRDKLRRSVLHVAVQSGSAVLVERVLQVTDDLLNAADVHGWTPLHYAARGCHGIGAPVPSSATWSKEVIQLLLDKGSDLWSASNGVEREWPPLKLARYHGAPQDVLDLLTPEEKTGKDGKQWDEKEHSSMKAFKTSVYCDCCLFVSTSFSGWFGMLMLVGACRTSRDSAINVSNAIISYCATNAIGLPRYCTQVISSRNQGLNSKWNSLRHQIMTQAMKKQMTRMKVMRMKMRGIQKKKA